MGMGWNFLRWISKPSRVAIFASVEQDGRALQDARDEHWRLTCKKILAVNGVRFQCSMPQRSSEPT
jgi:hypothetical protein